jgi:hypothetical protein
MLVFGIFLMAETAFATSNAGNCISVSNGTMTNNCGQPVGIDLCHDDNGSSDIFVQNGVCDRNGGFYRNGLSLGPGESHNNPKMMPPGTRVHFAACFGTKYNIVGVQSDGSYRCK